MMTNNHTSDSLFSLENTFLPASYMKTVTAQHLYL